MTVTELMAFYYGELLQPNQFYGYTYFTTHGRTDTPVQLPSSEEAPADAAPSQDAGTAAAPPAPEEAEQAQPPVPAGGTEQTVPPDWLLPPEEAGA